MKRTIVHLVAGWLLELLIIIYFDSAYLWMVDKESNLTFMHIAWTYIWKYGVLRRSIETMKYKPPGKKFTSLEKKQWRSIQDKQLLYRFTPRIKLIEGRLYLPCQQSLLYLQILGNNSVTFRWQISSSPTAFLYWPVWLLLTRIDSDSYWSCRSARSVSNTADASVSHQCLWYITFTARRSCKKIEICT